MWTIENAWASGTSPYHEAVEAVRSGRFSCALVLGVDQMSTLFAGAIVSEATDPEGASSLPLPGLYAGSAIPSQPGSLVDGNCGGRHR